MKKREIFKNFFYKNNLSFILIGAFFIFLGLVDRYRVYSHLSMNSSFYFLFGIIFICFLFFDYNYKQIKYNFRKYLFCKSLYFVFFVVVVYLYFLIFYNLSPSLHEANWLIPIVRLILFILGINSTVDGNYLLFIHNDKTYKFAISYEQSAMFYFFLLFLVILFYSLFFYRSVKLLLRRISILFSLFLFRYIVFIFLFVYSNDIKIFYSQQLLTISIIPICCFAGYQNDLNTVFSSTTYEKKRFTIFTSLILSSIITLFIYGLYLFNGSSGEKNGRIFIDEYHSPEWESVFEPLNTENYAGQKSTYTYFSFVKLLEKIKPVSVITSDDDYNFVTSDDILIIKTPTIDFSDEVVKKIDNLIRNGAGVWFIGDHTNLLDMNTHLNKIVKRYGASFRYDSVYDLTTSNLTYYDSKLQPLFKHSIVADMHGYKFATSCSIKTSPFFNNVIIGNNLCSENQDLSHQNYFGDLSFSEEEYFGLFSQCSAKKIGKGRILLYSDSTTFSSFSVLMHTNPEFILSSIHYLNQKNSFNFYLLIAIVLLVIICFLIFIKHSQINYRMLPLFVILILPVFLLILSFFNNTENKRISIHIEDQLNSIPSIYFLKNYDEYNQSDIVSWWSSGIDDYSSMFLAFQRMGYFLREVPNLKNTDAYNNLMTVITKPLTNHENIHFIEHYLMNGGNILFVLSDRLLSSSIDFLKKFGIEYFIAYENLNIDNEYEILNSNTMNKTNLITTTFMPISNFYVDSIFSDYSSNVRIDKFKIGHGNIYILVHGNYFDNIGLGESATVPNTFQIDRHNEFYDLIKKILE